MASDHALGSIARAISRIADAIESTNSQPDTAEPGTTKSDAEECDLLLTLEMMYAAEKRHRKRADKDIEQMRILLRECRAEFENLIRRMDTQSMTTIKAVDLVRRINDMIGESF